MSCEHPQARPRCGVPDAVQPATESEEPNRNETAQNQATHTPDCLIERTTEGSAPACLLQSPTSTDHRPRHHITTRCQSHLETQFSIPEHNTQEAFTSKAHTACQVPHTPETSAQAQTIISQGLFPPVQVDPLSLPTSIVCIQQKPTEWRSSHLGVVRQGAAAVEHCLDHRRRPCLGTHF